MKLERKRIYQQRRNLIPSSFVFSSDSFHVLRFLERRIDYLHNRMKLVLLVTLLAVLYTVQYSNSAAVRSEVRYISTVYHNRCICWNKNRWSRWLFDREFAWIIWFFFFYISDLSTKNSYYIEEILLIRDIWIPFGIWNNFTCTRFEFIALIKLQEKNRKYNNNKEYFI